MRVLGYLLRCHWLWVVNVSIPNTKSTLKDWCLRKLGYPVLDINVDDDQVDDRIDEALQYFYTFQYGGMQRAYLKHQVTQADIARAGTNDSEVAVDDSNPTISSTWEIGKGFIVVPEAVQSVLRVMPFSNRGNLNMFDVRYQMRLNDLYDFSSQSVIHYSMTMKHLDFLDSILVGEKPLQFNVHQNRLYINMDWDTDISVGEYIIVECYRKLDPTTWVDVYNDLWLKRYSTSLIKRQWGENLMKFNDVTMLGGITINGETIYNEAKEEIEKLEEESKLTWEEPLHFDVG